jgi:hypothetical protein
MKFREWWNGQNGSSTPAISATEKSVSTSKKVSEMTTAIRAQFKSGVVSDAAYQLRRDLIKLPVNPETRRRHAPSSAVSRFEIPYPHRKKAADRLSLLATELRKIDIDRADLAPLTRIRSTLNETIPKKLREMELLFPVEGWEDEAIMLEDIQDLAEELLSVVGALPSHMSKLHIGQPGTMMEEEPAETEQNREAASFPDISTYNEDEELFTALTELKDDWKTASTIPLSTEDEFTIDQVASSYLPDALQFHTTFRLRTGPLAKERARELLLEQVQLIHKQVTFVLEQHTDESFSKMEAHTSFLKAKVEGLGA